jgi:hypothetical protein
MKLPDFSHFSPLDDNRKNMKAARSDQHFVQIEELDKASLETKTRQAAPQQKRQAVAGEAVPVAPGISTKRPRVQIINRGPTLRQTLVRTVIITELLLLINAGIAYVVYPYIKPHDVSEYLIIGNTRTVTGIDQPEIVARKQLR